MKRVAIIQSNYLPWVGYFDLLHNVDQLVFLDTVQYTRRDWRNRNKIKSSNGAQWITVPVNAKGNYHQKIKDTLIFGDQWKQQHLDLINSSYSRSPYFDDFMVNLTDLFYEEDDLYLSKLNHRLTQKIASWLRLGIEFIPDYKFLPPDCKLTKSERLAHIAKSVEATHYVSGPAAKGYLDEKYFSNFEIKIEWFEYKTYPMYHQPWGEFVPNLSIIDYLFNCGVDNFFDHIGRQ